MAIRAVGYSVSVVNDMVIVKYGNKDPVVIRLAADKVLVQSDAIVRLGISSCHIEVQQHTADASDHSSIAEGSGD